jgi:hypothetical protein
MLSEWPERTAFSPEIPGNHVLWFNPVVAPPAWHENLPPVVERLTRTIMA